MAFAGVGGEEHEGSHTWMALWPFSRNLWATWLSSHEGEDNMPLIGVVTENIPN